MRPVFFILFFALSKLGADVSPFENQLNHHSGEPVHTVRVVGERCTGTSYIHGLLRKNLPETLVTAPKKHFLPWFDLPSFNITKKTGSPKDANILGELNNFTLLLLVVRDPYDWVRSFYEHPWHVSKEEMLGKGLFHFIKHEWIPSDDEFEYIHPDHWNPYDHRRFKNVLELRKYKTLNYLQIGLLIQNFLIVRYETVAKNPEAFVQFVSDYCQAKKADVFENVLTYKNSKKEKKTYKGSHYEPLTVKELGFINNNLDWGVEHLVGYELVGSVERIEKR